MGGAERCAPRSRSVSSLRTKRRASRAAFDVSSAPDDDAGRDEPAASLLYDAACAARQDREIGAR
jgi:hypothetical protein